MVGLEPSCVAVFRDEMPDLFPHDEDAKRLRKQTFTLAEFLQQKAPHFQPLPLHRKAVVHGHCHHKAIFGMDHEEQLLRKMVLTHHSRRWGAVGWQVASASLHPTRYR